jgi:hypothetical protein
VRYRRCLEKDVGGVAAFTIQMAYISLRIGISFSSKTGTQAGHTGLPNFRDDQAFDFGKLGRGGPDTLEIGGGRKGLYKAGHGR